MCMTTTTEQFGRYEIEISGPDSLSNNCYWVKVKSTKSKLGRTPNHFSALVKTLAEAQAKVDAFKASKTK